MGGRKAKVLKVLGATIRGFAQACINLNIMAGSGTDSLINRIEVSKWYPFERLREIERYVIKTYESSGPILERVGIQQFSVKSKNQGWNLRPRGALFFRTSS